MLGLSIDLSDLHSCPQCHHELVSALGLFVPVLIFLRVPTELHPVHRQLCDHMLKSVERVHVREPQTPSRRCRTASTSEIAARGCVVPNVSPTSHSAATTPFGRCTTALMRCAIACVPVSGSLSSIAPHVHRPLEFPSALLSLLQEARILDLEHRVIPLSSLPGCVCDIVGIPAKQACRHCKSPPRGHARSGEFAALAGLYRPGRLRVD